ncbi:GNAT family N-acetyltransferase [Photobacterium kagoshimensis]|uniref:GNAT family N-acetyltransferase n=1 Tax=Photobacterium kagoshimensis TaxID=2910242 RepID=UPI003D0D6434
MTSPPPFTVRTAYDDDYEFLFELKKQTEFEPIKNVFGWDETVQRRIHAEEWLEERPLIIESNGKAIGSYLVQDQGDKLYFCRFFILPSHQGLGIGSQILNLAIKQAQHQQLPLTLSYLQSNRVGALYQRMGFVQTGEDKQFVYMCYQHKN